MFRLVNQMKLWEVWVLVLWIKEKKQKHWKYSWRAFSSWVCVVSFILLRHIYHSLKILHLKYY